MKLLVDAGNTRIKWALVSGDGWLCNGVLPVTQAANLSQHFADHLGRIDSRDLHHCWVSNVAGEQVARHIQAACAARQCEAHFITAQASQCGVLNGYARHSQLGSDRWASLIAAWQLTGHNCLVVNSGTATTIDALSASGEFIGGLILPGVELMQRSLCAATTLPEPAQGNYAPFPLNTVDALFSGAIQATCGAIGRQYALLGDASAPVLLSGGAASQLQAHLRHVAGEAASHLTGEANNVRQVAGYGKASRLREWPYITLPIRMMDNLVLQGLWLIAQEESA